MGYQHIKGRATASQRVTAGKANHRLVGHMSRSIFKLTVEEGVREYFLIHCGTRVSRIIFKLTVARGCQGLFSNSLTHAGVQEYFQIDSRTRLSRTIF